VAVVAVVAEVVVADDAVVIDNTFLDQTFISLDKEDAPACVNAGVLSI
jgi:hypothetical protein